MGVGVSGWPLARAVGKAGQMGVISGSMIDTVMVRRLQDGDVGGHIRRAIEKFPVRDIATDAFEKYFRPGGKPSDEPYSMLPMWKKGASRARKGINMLAAFVEVHLAKQGHDSPIGMNLLTKVQLPNLSALYGAILAGVDYILMGAGIPREVPGALDRLAEHETATFKFELENATPEEAGTIELDPGDYWAGSPPPVRRPKFLAIVSNDTLASFLARKANGHVDGFVVEHHVAGGHNAPPRSKTRDADGLPAYGERDEADLEKMAEIGRPFWLAGGAGRPESLPAALDAGAAGIQVGTLFAYCDESGIDPEVKRSVLAGVVDGTVAVRTDFRASPTGFPFKMVEWPDDPFPASGRKRVCDLGYLREAYKAADGKVRYRCASEPVDAYAKKEGDLAATEGRQCLCNGLLGTIGQGQARDDNQVGAEPALVTSGDELERMAPFLSGRDHYSAADVVEYLTSRVPAMALA
jgi:NAD(P)H-dependent flavin oxidoreductase YrpB (nitropropane dioxygenase family)